MIDRVSKGDDTRTLMHADVANQLIDAINSLLPLLNLVVAPPGIGGVKFGGDNVTVDISVLADTVRELCSLQNLPPNF